MGKFNAKEHLIKLGNKDYLEVAWRIVWFREDNPNGRIDTDIQAIGELIIVKASIWNNDGVAIASGIATVRAAENIKVKWAGREFEKAETAAIGRALAIAGYGTQFTGDEMDEGDYLSDSPVSRNKASGNTSTGQPDNVTTANFGNAAWRDEVFKATAFLYDHPNHQANSVNALLQNGKIKDTDKPVVSILQILFHNAEKQYGLSETECKAIIGAQVEGTVADYMKSPGATVQTAWGVIAASQTPPLAATGTEDIPF